MQQKSCCQANEACQRATASHPNIYANIDFEETSNNCGMRTGEGERGTAIYIVNFDCVVGRLVYVI